jgi:acyl carrier protein
MTDDTILRQEVAALLFHDLNVDASSAHEDLIENGLLDSLKIVELLVRLEQRYALRIPLEELDIDSFRSIAAIARLISQLCASAGALDTAAAALPAPAVSLRAAD